MSTKDNSGPAFPMPSALVKNMTDLLEGSGLSDEHKEHLAEQLGEKACGMTLRDYFAAKAMQGLMGRAWGDTPAEELFAIWSKSAYAVADAMLKARTE